MMSLLLNKWLPYAVCAIVIFGAYEVWITEHNKRVLSDAQAKELAQTVEKSNLALAQLNAKKEATATKTQVVIRKIYVHPSSTACSSIPAIADALDYVTRMRGEPTK